MLCGAALIVAAGLVLLILERKAAPAPAVLEATGAGAP